MKNKNILIISCGAVKKEGSFKAEELYIGLMFKLALKFAKSIKGIDEILILSGKYGLINLDDVIESYNMKLPKDFKFDEKTINYLNNNNVFLLVFANYEKIIRNNGIDIKLSLIERLNYHNRHKEFRRGCGYIYQFFNNNNGKSIDDFVNNNNINWEFKTKKEKLNG